MANVLATLKNGRSVVLPNTTVAAVITALGSGEAQTSFTLANGEIIAIGNEEIASLAQEATGTIPGGAAPGGEEPGSGRFPAS